MIDTPAQKTATPGGFEIDDTTVAKEQNIAARAAANMRSCSGCVSCCRVYRIPILEKRAGQLCAAAEPGHGCTIYPDRPPICRRFACRWLASDPGEFQDWWQPLQSGAVLSLHEHPNDGDPLALYAWWDSALPFRLHEEPYLSDLRERAKRYRVFIAIDAQECYELRPAGADPVPEDTILATLEWLAAEAASAATAPVAEPAENPVFISKI